MSPFEVEELEAMTVYGKARLKLAAKVKANPELFAAGDEADDADATNTKACDIINVVAEVVLNEVPVPFHNCVSVFYTYMRTVPDDATQTGSGPGGGSGGGCCPPGSIPDVCTEVPASTFASTSASTFVSMFVST